MTPQIGIFSFFSGAGFLDLGFEKSGYYESLFVNEYHKPFMDVYKYSHKILGITEPIYGYHLNDVNDFLQKKKMDIIKDQVKEYKANGNYVGFIGGPPCPDFSVGGKNKGETGDNGKLSWSYIELVCKTKPDFFLFENVKGLYRTIKHRQFFDTLKKKLTDAGYYLTENLINAIEYGTPQDRERIILIGFRKKYVN